MSDSSYEKQKRIALKNLMLENTQLITEAKMRKNASPNTLGREHKVVSTVLTKRQADFVKQIVFQPQPKILLDFRSKLCYHIRARLRTTQKSSAI